MLDGESIDRLLTVEEVCRILRVDPTTVRRWIRDGKLDVVDLPRRGNRRSYRIKQSTIEKIGVSVPEELLAHIDGN